MARRRHPQYAWAVLENWQVPAVPPDPALRAALEGVARAEGPAALHARLAAVDPAAAARIDPRNVRRVVRALEVFEKTGRPISAWQEKRPPDFEYLLFAIDVPRKELYERVDRRVEQMFAGGLLDEVRALLEAGVPPDAPAMSSIGYEEAAGYLLGRCTLDDAIERAKRATHRLIRSREQWFRRDDPRITWVRDAEDIELQANIFTGVCTNVIRGERR
ncbi:tRNA dimethylallyltransferase [Tepidiforma flava]|uniref:tRNA dimethylallyltransferase n=1 Tax=Tepidiforma flava TaxID=3004094 RepID=A0ABY7M7S6_9CHLR|nr:tRNA dimethylallyltransferase [Tepidiforma flava]WBL36207.1 tRNA dimethylallyltransferase [Tepidiforma flava]